MNEILKNFLGMGKEKERELGKSSVVQIPQTEEPEAIKLPEVRFALGYDYDLLGGIGTIKDLIKMYREISINYEIDDATQEITNEAVVVDEKDPVVKINLDDVKLSASIKKKITEEFDHLLSLLDFNTDGDEIFKKWYIDGRLYVQRVFDSNKPKEGIKELRIISPIDLTRIKVANSDKLVYVFKPANSTKKWQIDPEHITFVPSGITDPVKNFYISYLHRSVKPLNQLRLLEDSAIIYRITRAPERRVFYVDVGKLPKAKAEDYIKNLIAKFKNKVVYDSATGEISQKKNVMTMIEDFWLPRTEGGKGTQVETLQGGTQLGEITDIEYFKKKLYKSLKVPPTRFDTEAQAGISFDRMGEITREEMRFSKFVNKLKSKFSFLFLDTLKMQLLMKKIINEKDWEVIKNLIKWMWNKDNYYEQIKKHEVTIKNLEVLQTVEEYRGNYFSKEWIQKNVLFLTDGEIKDMDKEMKKEEAAGEEPPEGAGGEEEPAEEPPEGEEKPEEEQPPEGEEEKPTEAI